MSDDNTIRPALSDPDTCHEYDEDGNVSAPWVRWDLSWGCASTIGYEGEDLVALVSTSDEDQRTGITRRVVTREQVASYARKLLALIGETPLLGGDVEQELNETRTRLVNWQKVAELAKRQLNEAWTPVRTLRQQCDEAIARADKAEESLGYLRRVLAQTRNELAATESRADKAEAERDALHTGIRDWLTANSVLAFDAEMSAEVLVQHLNITATGYRERAEKAGNPAVRDLAYRTLRRQRDEAIARANNAADADGKLLEGDVQVTLHTPGTYEGDAQVVAIGEAIERMRDGADGTDIAHAVITVLRGETARYAHAASGATEPICRCGHLESAHDAGECWTAPDNHDHPTPKCECAWYTPIDGGGDE